MPINPPDIIISSVLLFFSFNGFRNGFIVEIGRIISIIIGFIVSSKFHFLLLPYIKIYITEEKLQTMVAYIACFIITVIIVSIVIQIIQKFIDLIFLGWLNRILGFLLGLLKGFLVVSIMIFIIQSIPFTLDKEDSIKNKLENNSIMYQICNHVKELIILTPPIQNHINILQQKTKILSDEESIQEFIKSP